MMLYIWRHPKPLYTNGVCYGQTDVHVDYRQIKRLANQIQDYVNTHNLPKTIWVSHLSRSRQIGELLAKRGFKCHVDTRLAESHFGVWEGVAWQNIAKSEIDIWCDNFASFAPEGGENLSQLFQRVQAWIDERHIESRKEGANLEKPASSDHLSFASVLNYPILAVGHAGWITAAKFLSAGRDVPHKAIDWSKPTKYGELTQLRFL